MKKLYKFMLLLSILLTPVTNSLASDEGESSAILDKTVSMGISLMQSQYGSSINHDAGWIMGELLSDNLSTQSSAQKDYNAVLNNLHSIEKSLKQVIKDIKDTKSDIYDASLHKKIHSIESVWGDIQGEVTALELARSGKPVASADVKTLGCYLNFVLNTHGTSSNVPCYNSNNKPVRDKGMGLVNILNDLNSYMKTLIVSISEEYTTNTTASSPYNDITFYNKLHGWLAAVNHYRNITAMLLIEARHHKVRSIQERYQNKSTVNNFGCTQEAISTITNETDRVDAQRHCDAAFSTLYEYFYGRNTLNPDRTVTLKSKTGLYYQILQAGHPLTNKDFFATLINDEGILIPKATQYSSSGNIYSSIYVTFPNLPIIANTSTNFKAQFPVWRSEVQLTSSYLGFDNYFRYVTNSVLTQVTSSFPGFYSEIFPENMPWSVNTYPQALISGGYSNSGSSEALSNYYPTSDNQKNEYTLNCPGYGPSIHASINYNKNNDTMNVTVASCDDFFFGFEPAGPPNITPFIPYMTKDNCSDESYEPNPSNWLKPCQQGWVTTLYNIPTQDDLNKAFASPQNKGWSIGLWNAKGESKVRIHPNTSIPGWLFANESKWQWPGETYGDKNFFTGDFNSDDIWDVGLWNINNDSTVHIYYGKTGGGFDSHTSWQWAGGLPKSPNFFTGDFNGDGKWDIGLWNPNGQKMTDLLYGIGDGTFGTFSSKPLHGASKSGTYFTGDFNADGIWDFGLWNASGQSIVKIWYGSFSQGKTSFSNPTTWQWKGGMPQSPNFFTGDFNGDGMWDIGLWNPNGDSGIFILDGVGKGQFGDLQTWTWPSKQTAGTFFTGKF